MSEEIPIVEEWRYIKAKAENKKLKDEVVRLNNIINELEKDIENQITFCTNEVNGTTNDKYCRIAINYLKHLKDKLQELKENKGVVPLEELDSYLPQNEYEDMNEQMLFEEGE